MKSAMPTLVISPSLFALGIEFDQLLKSGFGESYHEITRFKQTIVTNESVEQLLKPYTSGFVAFIGDNGDHSVATLNGKGTFHGMGIIAAIPNKG